jgi:hypothetical protein
VRLGAGKNPSENFPDFYVIYSHFSRANSIY